MNDLELHIWFGTVAAMVAWAGLWLAQDFGWHVALGLWGLALGLGVEAYQRIRREGASEWRDALMSALPLELAALLAWWIA